jgi:hypothetical protein
LTWTYWEENMSTKTLKYFSLGTNAQENEMMQGNQKSYFISTLKPL